MTARQIANYMIRNGACPSEVYCDVANGVVYFDKREVPAKSYANLPLHHVDAYNVSISSPL